MCNIKKGFVYPLLLMKVHVVALNIVTVDTFIDLRSGYKVSDEADLSN